MESLRSNIQKLHQKLCLPSAALMRRVVLGCSYILSSSTPLHDSKILFTPQKILTEEEKIQNLIKSQYGIDIEIPRSSYAGEYRFEKVTPSLQMLTLLREALLQYPKSLILASNIHYIQCTKNLTSHRDIRCANIHDCDNKTHFVKTNGVQFPYRKILYINIEGHVNDTEIAETVTRVIHHEIFHAIDDIDHLRYQDYTFWTKANRQGKQSYLGPEWRRLEQYTKQGKMVYGFADTYGSKTYDEDKATLNASLRTPKYAKKILRQCMDDSILRRKVEMLTGCQLRNDGRGFERTLSEEEYCKLFETNGFEYFPRWGKKYAHEIVMDHKYWNALIKAGQVSATIVKK